MTLSQRTSRHASDGDLIRGLDGQLSDLEQRRLRNHLAECADCGQRSAELQAHAAVARQYLRRDELGSGPDELTRARALAAIRQATRSREAARRRKPLHGAAVAAVLILALAVGSAQPVRAWVMERVAEVRGAPMAAPALVAEMPATVVARRGSIIAFQPAGEVFEIRLEHPQQAGAVGLTVRPVDRATAQMSGDGTESIMILPSGLRIENRAASTARYWITLPSSLGTVRVVAGSRVLATLPVSELGVGSERVIPLSPTRR